MNINEAITELSKEIHTANYKWWHDAEGNPLKRNFGELMALAHSELSEAFEAICTNSKDEHLPHLPGFEVELVDTFIRLMDTSTGLNLKIGEILQKFFINGNSINIIDTPDLLNYMLNRSYSNFMDKNETHPKDVKYFLLLCIHKNLSDALEGDRKNLPSKAFPGYSQVEASIAFAILHIFIAARVSQNFKTFEKSVFVQAFIEKMEYNAKRIDHTHTHRAGQHGKKY